MSDLEEDIKFIKEMIKEYKIFGDLDNPDYEDTNRIYNAIEHILAERKQDKERIQKLEEEKKTMCEEYCPKTERIQELEEENKEIKNTKMNGYLHENIWLAKYLSELYLPKQKAKEKIEENNIIMINMQNRHPDIYVLSDEWRNAKAQNKVLEELLEDK